MTDKRLPIAMSYSQGKITLMSGIRPLLWSARATITALVSLWAIYLLLYVAGATFPVTGGDSFNPARLAAQAIKDHLTHTADFVGHVAALGATPTPTIAGIVLVCAAAFRESKRSVDNLIERSRIKESDTVDAHDLTGLPATPSLVVTAAPPDLGCAALGAARRAVEKASWRASASLSPSLGDIIDREELYARRLELRRLDRAEMDGEFDDNVLVPIGPVQSILLDPMLTSLTGEARVARVKQILHETKPAPFIREVAPLLLSLIGMLAFFGLLMADLIPLVVALPGAVVCAAVTMIPRRHGAYLHGPNRLVVPPRYPTITLDGALQLATLTPQLWHTTITPPAPITEPTTDHTTEHTADHADRRRRIAEVHAAIAELDAEWLDYHLDLHAWYLAKPQLRNLNDPIIKAYREAEADLRDRADDLTEHCTDQQITAAQDAARRALKAWGTANHHALSIGVSTLTPSEEAALHTLHGLVSQLNDRATPQAMWPQLRHAIIRTMDKLITVPCTLADIATLPVVDAESRLRAIEQHATHQPPNAANEPR